MRFRETAIHGAYVIEPERVEDERGFFARTWCQRESVAQGLPASWVQSSISFNRVRGTVRGMHYQAWPYPEAKLVRCTRGAIHDVFVDLRPDSPTYGHHVTVVLSADNGHLVYIPPECAHGFQTLEDNSEVSYMMSEFYHHDCSKGLRWDDPALSIVWPLPITCISDRDRTYPDAKLMDNMRSV
ncbi:MAG TPA: dTDP-4-dehydrorhamnose 3,5-epimerase [Nitrospiraceae bacterium]|nr:dTDP-4-dehydrorhamnose 3,5-epimerase [Nitrospiraceae bacterium]